MDHYQDGFTNKPVANPETPDIESVELVSDPQTQVIIETFRRYFPYLEVVNTADGEITLKDKQPQ